MLICVFVDDVGRCWKLGDKVHLCELGIKTNACGQESGREGGDDLVILWV